MYRLYQTSRKWTDAKDRETKNGKFSIFEEEILLKKMKDVIKEDGLSRTYVHQLLRGEAKQKKKNSVWIRIAESLPHRSVQSVALFFRRRFCKNVKGKWTPEEEKLLLAHVRENGRQFSTIGKILNRNSVNCREKYESLGGENAEYRTQGWTYKETILLLKLIQKRIKRNIFSKEPPEDFNFSTLSLRSSRKYNRKNVYLDPILVKISEYLNVDNIKKEGIPSINWSKISKKMKTKGKDDCRNRWNNQITNYCFKKEDFNEDAEENLIKRLIKQRPEFEDDLDFSSIKNGKSESENQSHFEKLKKVVTSRRSQSIKEILTEIEHHISKTKLEKKKEQKMNSNSNIDSGDEILSGLEDVEDEKIEYEVCGLEELFQQEKIVCSSYKQIMFLFSKFCYYEVNAHIFRQCDTTKSTIRQAILSNQLFRQFFKFQKIM